LQTVAPAGSAAVTASVAVQAVGHPGGGGAPEPEQAQLVAGLRWGGRDRDRRHVGHPGGQPDQHHVAVGVRRQPGGREHPAGGGAQVGAADRDGHRLGRDADRRGGADASLGGQHPLRRDK
jgi:hypothetical protein